MCHTGQEFLTCFIPLDSGDLSLNEFLRSLNIVELTVAGIAIIILSWSDIG